MSQTVENAELITGFRLLRPAVHEWLARDLTGPPMDFTRAYADLMFAYGFARLGKVDDAVTLVADATHSLSSSANEAHGWLLRLFRYRIDEALSGQSVSGVLPKDVLREGREKKGLNDRIGFEVYATDVVRSKSRILDPFGAVNPYAEWTKTQDSMRRRVCELSQLHDSGQIADNVLAILDDAATLNPQEKARTWSLILPHAAHGEQKCVARILEEVPSVVLETILARHPNKHIMLELRFLVASAIERATTIPDGELIPPLLEAALAVIRAVEDAPVRMQLLGEIGWSFLRRFRRLGDLRGATDFLIATREWWPGTTWEVGDRRLLESEESSVFAATAEAALCRFVDQPRAGNILDAVVRVSTLHCLSAKGLATAFSGAACAMALWPTNSTFDKLIDLLRRVNRVSNAWQTAQYYSRLHLQMAESIVLAFPEVRGI